MRGAGDGRRRPASPDPHRGGAARGVSAAPRGRECPLVSSPLSGSTPLRSGCACAGDGSAGRSIPRCGSQEREPHGMLRFDSLSTPRTLPAYHLLGAVGGAPVSADVKGLGQMSGVLQETRIMGIRFLPVPSPQELSSFLHSDLRKVALPDPWQLWKVG